MTPLTSNQATSIVRGSQGTMQARAIGKPYFIRYRTEWQGREVHGVQIETADGTWQPTVRWDEVGWTVEEIE